jgi:exopolysaccharide production protein ExoZ
MRDINSIQYLRGLAAISVLVFHLTEGFEGTKFEIGSAGVDVFFVISGFIMWVTTADRAWTPQNFMLR